MLPTVSKKSRGTKSEKCIRFVRGKAICSLHGRLVDWGGEIQWTMHFGVAEFFLAGSFLNAKFIGGSVPSKSGSLVNTI